jgi:hypothetical protein
MEVSFGSSSAVQDVVNLVCTGAFALVSVSVTNFHYYLWVKGSFATRSA